MREANERTSWTAPDEAYERAVLGFARAAAANPDVRAQFDAWQRRCAPGVRAATLGTKLVQLTLPGVADVYQGCETVSISLVDPDNRRPVDVEPLAGALARLDAGEGPRDLADEKLLVTSRALRLRRARPGAFVGPDAGYHAVASSSGHAFAFVRTDGGRPVAVTVATRLALALERLGGWGEHVVALPDGDWHELLTDRVVPGGLVRLADLLATYPVALLTRAEDG